MTHGREEPPTVCLERVMVISPHFDDAVLSCGHLVAAASEAMVLTVFGGTPPRYPLRSDTWDTRCGFDSGDDVVEYRRAENASALEVLGALDRSCGLIDGQYRGRHRYATDEVIAVLAPVVESWHPTTVVIPLGMGHRDHRLSCAAALSLRRGREHLTWACYTEYPYAWREIDRAARRLGRVRRMGYRLTPILGLPPSPEVKAKALASYASQLIGLELVDDVDRVAAAPEQLWLLTDRPPLLRRAVRRAAYELGRLPSIRGLSPAHRGGGRLGRRARLPDGHRP